MNLVIVCHDDFFLISSDLVPISTSKEGGKWWEKDSDYADYEPDILIPLVINEGEYTGVMVEDTKDVYSTPTHSPRKKSEEENVYYNLDPSPSPSPSTHKKKSVSSSLRPIVQFKLKWIKSSKTYNLFLFIFMIIFFVMK